MLILNIRVDLTNQLNGIEFIGRFSKTIITLTPSYNDLTLADKET